MAFWSSFNMHWISHFSFISNPLKKYSMHNDTKLSTSRLFHYTYSKESLIGILEKGFQPKFSLEKLGILKKEDITKFISKELDIEVINEEITDEFAIPMCCFCDIPLNLVENHTKIYGEYAIGLKKDWGEKQSICPVIYLPEHGETQTLFESLIRSYTKNIKKIHEIRIIKQEQSQYNEELLYIDILNIYNNILHLTMFLKPYKGVYVRKGVTLEDYKFYDEREWRYKPNEYLCQSFMSKEEYLSYNSSEERNKDMGYIDFDLSDITDIIVPVEEVNVIRNLVLNIPKFNNLDLKIIHSI